MSFLVADRLLFPFTCAGLGVGASSLHTPDRHSARPPLFCSHFHWYIQSVTYTPAINPPSVLCPTFYASAPRSVRSLLPIPTRAPLPSRFSIYSFYPVLLSLALSNAAVAFAALEIYTAMPSAYPARPVMSPYTAAVTAPHFPPYLHSCRTLRYLSSAPGCLDGQAFLHIASLAPGASVLFRTFTFPLPSRMHVRIPFSTSRSIPYSRF